MTDNREVAIRKFALNAPGSDDIESMMSALVAIHDGMVERGSDIMSAATAREVLSSAWGLARAILNEFDDEALVSLALDQTTSDDKTNTERMSDIVTLAGFASSDSPLHQFFCGVMLRTAVMTATDALMESAPEMFTEE